MKSSKVYISLTTKNITVILEAPTPVDGRNAYRFIKEHVPSANLSIYGARDIQTLRRTHRELKPTRVVRDVNKFLQAVTSTMKKTILA
ncbi:hypothetical protein NST12_16855 [Bacillus sp. FSL W8-1127]|jgi:hypothetical protein|uniref:hypothetical protein n=1 Tax=Bacillus TaxID=1386 RepID=UPI0030FB4BDC